MLSYEMLSAVIIFTISMIIIISEKVNRTIVAMIGAVTMILFNILTFEQAVEHIDFNTLGLLIGMMIIVTIMKNSGIFEYIAIFVSKKTKGDVVKIFISFILITAVLSALLDNVTTVLLIAPMTIVVTNILKINPIPFLIAEILASNIGGTATLVGDPPNILIGSAAGLDFNDFLINNGPPVLVILIVTCFILVMIYKKDFKVDEKLKKDILLLNEKNAIKDRSLLVKSVGILILTVIGFFTHGFFHIESSIVVLASASILLLISDSDIEEILAELEWNTIIFFTALFVMVGGLIEVGVMELFADIIFDNFSDTPILLMITMLWGSAIISSFLDNIPFVATLIPIILSLESQGMNVEGLWWAISLGACLGGNGTIIGSSANLVVAGIAKKNKHEITFGRYMKVAFPIMIVTILIATVFVLILHSDSI